MTKLPEIIPIFPLNGALLLPNGNLPLNIFEPRYINMVDYSMKNDRVIGMIQSKENKSLYSVGCLGKINQYHETGNGRYLINLLGIIRFQCVYEEKTNEKFRKLKVDYSKFKKDLNHSFDSCFNKNKFLEEAQIYLKKNNINANWDTMQKTDKTLLITTLASICPFSISEKQAILESTNINEIPKILENLFKMSTEESRSLN